MHSSDVKQVFNSTLRRFVILYKSYNGSEGLGWSARFSFKWYFIKCTTNTIDWYSVKNNKYQQTTEDDMLCFDIRFIINYILQCFIVIFDFCNVLFNFCSILLYYYISAVFIVLIDFCSVSVWLFCGNFIFLNYCSNFFKFLSTFF